MDQGSGIPSRSRHSTEDALKRGSDSLLEAKLKDQLNKPRSLTNRAQSLDLTYSLSRITESNLGMVPPDSPTTSTTGGDTGGNSSPISVTAPSFPSVYGPPGGGPQTTSLAPGGPSAVGLGATAVGGPICSTGVRLSAMGPSGSAGPNAHQRSGRTPDNEDVSKMFSNLGL